MTATRMTRAATLAVAVAVWCVCAWLLARTSVPSLHLSGLDEHRYFSQHLLDRAHSYSRGSDLLWLAGKVVEIATLVLLVRILPRSVRGMGLGRIGAAIIVGMVLLTATWAAGLPVDLLDYWWQHHWGLGPFDVWAWFSTVIGTLWPEALSVMVGIVLVIGLAGRYPRRWWLIAGPVIVVISAFFAFVSGWLGSSPSHALHNQALAADARVYEQREHVVGTPIRVQEVSSWTSQANAFTVGFGPSAHVVLWDTLLDGRFTRGEEDAVVAHELGHVRSRHIIKAIGWSALIVLPTLWLLGFATRRRGGLGDPANLPYAVLVLVLLGLVTAPFQTLVTRRYEQEADWRSLNATRDPAATQKLFQSFARTSLEDPDPGVLDYVWLEDHPTLMQRIAMARDWSVSARPSRGGPGSP
jgi:STE24 endopeptidase